MSDAATERVDWVDYAKGWCIILVVMMHSTLGVSEALGSESFLNDFVAWARPFRMPDFFLVAGLFLSRTIDKPLRVFLDRKVVHFAYFYLLWTLIQGVPKLLLSENGDPIAVLSGLAFALIEPFGTLWFIYLLPIFFVTVRLTRRAPKDLVFAAAALLQMMQISTDWTLIDEFAGRFVFFFAGYAFAPTIFAFAERARRAPSRALPALLGWGVLNGLAVRSGVASLPGVSLLLGFAGAAAVVAFSALLAESGRLPALRWLGARSIVVYLAFFLPMALMRSALLWLGFDSPAFVSIVVTIVALVVPLLLASATRDTRLRFLFRRPDWLRIDTAPASIPDAHFARGAS